MRRLIYYQNECCDIRLHVYHIVHEYDHVAFVLLNVPKRAVAASPIQRHHPVVAVYVANRALPIFKDKSEHPPNVMLLDNAALTRFYGPTLSGGHAFLLRLGAPDDVSVNVAKRLSAFVL